MFFRKKPSKSSSKRAPGSADGGAENRRKHYRVPPGSTERIWVSLMCEGSAPIGGDCVDLSIGGTVVEFDGARDPNLAVGNACMLRICASSQNHAINATCRVVAVRPLDKGWTRIAFEFTNRIELYAQLDEYYAGLFNRRRQIRVIPGFDIRIPVTLTWKTGSLATTVLDISAEGLGLKIPLEKGEALARIPVVEIALRLPKERADIVFRGAIKSRSQFAKTCLLGIEFSTEGDVEHAFEVLRRFVQERVALMQAWNKKSAKRMAS
jgi:c-di-GMP-binding flagellar brake protein YcgR